MLGVDAGVDHQADGAPDVGFEAAVIGVRVLVKADILAQMLGVERPALDVGRVFAVFAEGGDAGELLGDGDLQVVAGDAFVVGDGLDGVEVAVGGVVGVDQQAAGAAAVGRAGLVVGGRRGLLPCSRASAPPQRALWAGGRRAEGSLACMGAR